MKRRAHTAVVLTLVVNMSLVVVLCGSGCDSSEPTKTGSRADSDGKGRNTDDAKTYDGGIQTNSTNLRITTGGETTGISTSLSGAAATTEENSLTVATNTLQSTAHDGSSSVEDAGTGDPYAFFTADEREVLQALSMDRSRVEGAHGEDLAMLASAAGYATGYAVCRCLAESVIAADDLPGCAIAEALSLWVFVEQTRLPFAIDFIVENPQFEPDLRCSILSVINRGRGAVAECTGESATAVAGCEPSQEFRDAIFRVERTYECPDGTRVDSPRCNTLFDCADRSDELDCFDENGRDMVWCGDAIFEPILLCRDGLECATEATPPMCSPGVHDRFLCADGADIPLNVVCDRHDDCADGSDETACLR